MGTADVAGIVEIDEDLVRGLLKDQHPDLAGLDLRLVDGGWDNQVWRLGEELAVRLPRTERAPGLLGKEARWLPVLAPRLPLPVPVAVRRGAPSARVPRPWTVAAWVPGAPGDLAPISRADDGALRLAAFLRALHRDAPADAPGSADRGGPLGPRTDGVLWQLDQVATDGVVGGHPVQALRDVWDDAAAAPGWTGAPQWLHGDLHPANIVTSGGTLCGVLDFGDMCTGDPATDLAAAWVLLPAGAAPRFLAAYAHPHAAPDPAMIRRARGWAVLRALALIGIGQAGDRGLPGGKPTWGRAGFAALDRVLGS